MPTPRLAAITLLLISSTASAQVVVARDGYASPPEETGPAAPRRVEARAGLLLGGSDVGDADGFSLGLTTGLGYRIGDITLRGRFDYYRVGDGDDEAMSRRGRASRIGGALRYSFASTDVTDSAGGAAGDFWGELGLGLEHVAWKHGGVLDRPSAEVALGFDIDGYGRRRADGRRHHGGMFMAFRTLLAQGPEMAVPLTCDGPCDKPTRPSRTDVSMFFELGVHWGH